jgi:predicted HD phosphohydrolase
MATSPVAILNHDAADSKIPARVTVSADWYKSPFADEGFAARFDLFGVAADIKTRPLNQAPPVRSSFG